MKYEYERLNPDSFQLLCQSLVVAEYPDAQVYPVGQKDGGRDALSHKFTGATIFQVKFKRELYRDDDAAAVVIRALKEEAPKALRLKERGATSYRLLTNMRASSAADNGSMDRVQTYLDAEFPLPAMVWWRGDIDSRMNANSGLIWRFSELLDGGAVLQKLIENGFDEQQERRRAALLSFLQQQYTKDEDVKFKEADLSPSSLLDLYVDVPLTLERPGALVAHEGILSEANLLLHEQRVRAFEAGTYEGDRDMRLGAATFLLQALRFGNQSRLVLEGAPGQGKSTLAQYVCQVNRMKILGKTTLRQVEPDHRGAPARIPFKVDLRDLSTWLKGRDPFAAGGVVSPPLRSLEGFLAALVEYSSGGQTFTASDLMQVVARQPTLILLDGLDEVASHIDRRALIEKVDEGARRLYASASSLCVVVTSRPAAFADVPRFDSTRWPTLQLDSITESIALEYSDRWARSRRLSPQDASDIKSTLQAKLSLNHIRDLARNPMQLTILLSLIQSRGQSLPDQRTELYDKYVEVFFNRESDKSSIVRDNRLLLVDLHRFLAWKMHASAEAQSGDGRVSHVELRALISTFLTAREYESTTLDDIFSGVTQRVVALVSRVEGTFEFEVQPLREYFAARHLYDTAPYSPSGDPQRGTKPEIFEALAKRSYWLNVTRFYAGCYSVGELPSLTAQLSDLFDDDAAGMTTYPLRLASTLLQDRVFSQSPRDRKVLVRKICQPQNVRLGGASSGRIGGNPLRLHDGHGGEEVRTYLLSLALDPDTGVVGRAAAVAYASSYRRLEDAAMWAGAASRGSLEWWIEIGLQLGLYDRPISEAKGHAEACPSLRIALCNRVPGLLASDGSLQKWAAESNVHGTAVIMAHELDQSHLALRRLVPVLHYQWSLSDPADPREGALTAGLIDEHLKACALGLLELSQDGGSANAGGPDWQDLIDVVTKHYGDVWLCWYLAVMAALVPGRDSRVSGAGLFDTSAPLSERTVNASRHAGAIEWWRGQLRLAVDPYAREKWAFAVCSFADESVVAYLAADLAGILTSMPAARRQSLGYAQRRVALPDGGRSMPRRVEPSKLKLDFNGACALIDAIASRCVGEEVVTYLFRLYEKEGRAPELDLLKYPSLLSLLSNELVRSRKVADAEWLLLVLRSSRARHERGRPDGAHYANTGRGFSKRLASVVLEDSNDYPLAALAIADAVLTRQLDVGVLPLGVLAELGGWAAH